jgi:lysylphosphatidylglycerol synthetase-like protein (DUF2156 family)
MPTTDHKRGARALRDLREFLAFLENLWGVLATATVLFPLSNLLTAVLPLLPGAERLSTVLATLFSLFAIFLVFVLRHVEFTDDWGDGDIGFLILASIWTFVGGAAVLIVYLYVRLQPLAAGVVPVLYGSVFGLFTTAFTLLAVVEYVHEEAPREGPREEIGEVSELPEDVMRLQGRERAP